MVLWSGLTGCLVAVSTLLLVDRMIPGAVSIAPALPGEILVVIDGAVATPGVVQLAAGARLDAAIDAAGGLTANADTSSLNLAARIGDGERITIPSRVDRATPADAGPVGSPLDPTDTLIDINSAGLSELDQLPGVGPAIAQRIVDYREGGGGFDSVDELVEIEGISLEMVEELRPLVTIGG